MLSGSRWKAFRDAGRSARVCRAPACERLTGQILYGIPSGLRLDRRAALFVRFLTVSSKFLPHFS